MMTRPLTDAERATLALHAEFSLSYGRFLAPAIGRMLLTLLVAFLLLAVPLVLAKVDFTAWPAKDLLVLGVAAVIAFWAAIAARDLRRRRREFAPRQAELRADLAAGVAAVESRRATAAVRAIAPANGERCYFVRLDDGRVMFLGYWNPPAGDTGDRALEAGGFPATEFEIARAPRSGMALDVTARGSALEPLRTFTLRREVVEKGELPESGTIIDTPWESVATTYGAS